MKAILVIDIDYGNYESRISELKADVEVFLDSDDVLHYNNIKLLPMPEKKGQKQIPTNSPFPMLDGIAVLMDGVNAEYNDGWNDCIDELLGEGAEHE